MDIRKLKDWKAIDGRVLLKKYMYWVFPLVALLVLAVVLFPVWQRAQTFRKLPLEDTVRITKVRYVQEPFHSSVDGMWVSKGEEVNALLVAQLRQGRRPWFEKGTMGQEVVFFHLKNGEVLPAYVDGQRLGFEYGHIWVDVAEIQSFYDAMDIVELVEVKDPSQ
jgi:hypothetical protein